MGADQKLRLVLNDMLLAKDLLFVPALGVGQLGHGLSWS